MQSPRAMDYKRNRRLPPPTRSRMSSATTTTAAAVSISAETPHQKLHVTQPGSHPISPAGQTKQQQQPSKQTFISIHRQSQHHRLAYQNHQRYIQQQQQQQQQQGTNSGAQKFALGTRYQIPEVKRVLRTMENNNNPINSPPSQIVTQFPLSIERNCIPSAALTRQNIPVYHQQKEHQQLLQQQHHHHRHNNPNQRVMPSFQRAPPYPQPPLPPVPLQTPPPLPPPNRIPTAQRNYNQIPKTTINLLNDLYERHLLNQTKFEPNLSEMTSAAAPLPLPLTPSIANHQIGVAASTQHYRYAKTESATGGNSSSNNFNINFDAVSSNRSQLQYQYRRPLAGATGAAPASSIGERHFGAAPVSTLNNLAFPSSFSSIMKKPSSDGNHEERKIGTAGGGGDGSELGMIDALKYRRRNISCDINKDEKLLRRVTPIGGNNFSDRDFIEGGCYDYHHPAIISAEGDAGGIDVVAVAPDASANGCVDVDYRNSKINLMVETAHAISAASYNARTAQKMLSSSNGGGIGGGSGTTSHKSRSTDIGVCDRGGYCGVIQRAPPPMPPGLVRRLANKENPGMGKVKVMLRVADNPPAGESILSYLSIDKKKRQVILSESTTIAPTPSPSSAQQQSPAVVGATATTTTSSGAGASTTAYERGPMVAAPKMFAFDSVFTNDDTQIDVCSSALSEVIPAVLEGSDGCLLTLGYPGTGQVKTMFGSISSPTELGAIPCAISWLYKGINEKRQRSGARFSVRVSALGVNATKPGSSSKDLLAAHATDSDDSPGVYLRDDFLGGPTELRAPTPERAALFFDAALAGRPKGNLDPAFIFTLHVYQYSLAGRGGVAGGRSRLHLIDLGGCANRSGGLPLSAIGNTFLSILSGQRHPPNRDHPLTPLLKDCLAPLTCHVAVIAHVLHSQPNTDTLTTIQLASRIHRMRRRKHRFPLGVDKTLANSGGHQLSGSSEGPDPSSSDFSADTVIYMGPCNDETDGEHPPVYLPSLGSGEDNRCAMNKALKGSMAEKPNKTPTKKFNAARRDSAGSPITTLQRIPKTGNDSISSPYHGSPAKTNAIYASPQKLIAYKNSVVATDCKGINMPSPKGSPMKRPNMIATGQESPKLRQSEEKWVDGPRVSRAKVAEARHLLREKNHVKQCETWIDGPNTNPPPAKPALTTNSLAGTAVATGGGGYGFMDSHKKCMIRQWVENQTTQILSTQTPPTQSPQHQRTVLNHQLMELKSSRSESDKSMIPCRTTKTFLNSANSSENTTKQQQFMPVTRSKTEVADIESEKSLGFRSNRSDSRQINLDLVCNNEEQQQDDENNEEDEDEDSGPSEVPPALPLIESLSREISHDSIHLLCSRHHRSRESVSLHSTSVQMMDCGLQVTEEEIAMTMGGIMGSAHPLSALSNAEISVVSSFNIGDAFSECGVGDRTRHQFDQLARLREIFTSQLAMAEVVPAYKVGDAGSVYSEPAFRYTTGPGSVCSEPPYRAPSPTRCRGCRDQAEANLSRAASQVSLPSLDGIMQIAGMDQYSSLRHPDGASDPNLVKIEKGDHLSELPERFASLEKLQPYAETTASSQLPQLTLLPLTSTPEAYDSGHDSTPRTSKHSGISRRIESGYHSVATVRDSDESSFGSARSRAAQKITAKKKRTDKSLCHWLRNPFTCTYPDTEGEVSDF